ncbi:hypothetical protein EON63_16165, partial [archaeon]
MLCGAKIVVCVSALLAFLYGMTWYMCIQGADVRIILWARGLATAPAISYCASLCNSARSTQGGG